MQQKELRLDVPAQTPEEAYQRQPAVVVAQLGARMHYAVPELLHRGGVLEQLYTDAYAGQGSWLGPIVRSIPSSFQKGAVKRLAQRKANLPSQKVTCFNGRGLLGLAEHAWRQRTKTSLAEFYLRQSVGFAKKIIASRGLESASALYGFTGSSLTLFEFGKKSGLFCICEQMSAPVSEQTKEHAVEVKFWPGWMKHPSLYWLNDTMALTESREWDLADIILAPSPYVRTILIAAGVKKQKIALLPYGVSLNNFKQRSPSYDNSRSLRILFVGAVNLGKGIPYLLEALRQLKLGTAEARLVGKVEIEAEKLRAYGRNATFLGHISRQEVLEHYTWADILVMPSLSEGSATVTYEALASGLPVIATWNSGAWIKDSFNGFIIPVRDSQTLAKRLQLLGQNPELVHQMSHNASASAIHFSWDAYERRLLTVVDALHKNKMESLIDRLNLPYIPEKLE